MSFDRHLAEIAREFPDWTIWRSDAGRWWATRHHPLSDAERKAGCAMTIDADDPAGLRLGLLEQQGCMSTAHRAPAAAGPAVEPSRPPPPVTPSTGPAAVGAAGPDQEPPAPGPDDAEPDGTTPPP
ncbi:hypothetical protein ABGB17_30520 [Sphaerisporangium sp. B11E5]|uniref:hypothetical protein n=1 Tax=Sphaerisporangium sp. B11E5 TaxID=3153563 RepID=UPI00325C99E6